MSTQPPAGIVFPLQLAKKNARWRGQVAVSSFDRLDELLTATGPVEVQLQFSAIDRTSCRVTGMAEVGAAIECQSCLEGVAVKVKAAIDFRIVRSELEAQETASFAEPFLLHDESIAVAALIEDDLVMSLPTRGCDATGSCPNRPAYAYPADPDSGSTGEATGTERTNPFSVLAELKQREE